MKRWVAMGRRNFVVCVAAIVATAALGCQRTSKPVVRAPVSRSASAPSAQNDLKFLDTMTAHHEQAVLLWQNAATRATHPELRDFAIKAVEEQRREMFLMHSWRDRWFAGAAPSGSPADEGTAEGRMTMPPDTASDSAFDEAFLAMMVPHHQRAAAMARYAAANSELPEIRKLAQIIVDQQDDEVKAMEAWQHAWFGAQPPEGKRR